MYQKDKDMTNHVYCGNGKEKFFNNGGSIIEVMIDVDDLARNFNEYGFTTQAGKRKMRIKVCKSREIDQYGNTHYVEIDTWRPTPQNNAPPPPQRQMQAQPPTQYQRQAGGPPQQAGGYQNTQGVPGGSGGQNLPANGATMNHPGFQDDEIPF